MDTSPRPALRLIILSMPLISQASSSTSSSPICLLHFTYIFETCSLKGLISGSFSPQPTKRPKIAWTTSWFATICLIVGSSPILSGSNFPPSRRRDRMDSMWSHSFAKSVQSKRIASKGRWAPNRTKWLNHLCYSMNLGSYLTLCLVKSNRGPFPHSRRPLRVPTTATSWGKWKKESKTPNSCGAKQKPGFPSQNPSITWRLSKARLSSIDPRFLRF